MQIYCNSFNFPKLDGYPKTWWIFNLFLLIVNKWCKYICLSLFLLAQNPSGIIATKRMNILKTLEANWHIAFQKYCTNFYRASDVRAGPSSHHTSINILHWLLQIFANSKGQQMYFTIVFFHIYWLLVKFKISLYV